MRSVSNVYDIIAASDYPGVLVDADEVGVILPDDNDGKFTANEPGFRERARARGAGRAEIRAARSLRTPPF